MKAIHLLAVAASTGTSSNPRGDVTLEILDDLAAELARIFHLSCHVSEECLPADFAFDSARGQYHSSSILQRMESLAPDPEVALLGVTSLDLYVPVLTFVFGEAQLNGHCALVSLRRLQEEFYGLSPNRDLLQNRLRKEAIHELGHTLGLKHCFDWHCVMASSYSVERIDLKDGEFCPTCLDKAGLSPPDSSAHPPVAFEATRDEPD
jgi:archaemetzincin